MQKVLSRAVLGLRELVKIERNRGKTSHLIRCGASNGKIFGVLLKDLYFCTKSRKRMRKLNCLGLVCLFCVGLLGTAHKVQAQTQYQFGFLSYEKVLKSMPDYAKAQNSIQALKQKFDEEAKYNEEKFRSLFADYLQGQKKFPEQIMLKRQKELQVAMEQGISFRQDGQRMLQKAEADMLRPLEQQLDSVLSLIGRENGLLFIGNTDNKSFPFVHSESGLDITEIVIARLSGKIIPINHPIVPKPTEEPVAAPANGGAAPQSNGSKGTVDPANIPAPLPGGE